MESYPYSSSPSCQTGQKAKKSKIASEQDEKLQRCSPGQNQPTTTRQTHHQSQVSKESWADGGCVEQERRWQPHASWSMPTER